MILYRLRIWQEVNGVKASNYWYCNRTLLPPDVDHYLGMQSRASQFASCTLLARAIDNRVIGWEGQAFESDTGERLSGWLSGTLFGGDSNGLVLAESGPPNVCIRVDHASLSQRAVSSHYMPFVPGPFLDGSMNVSLAGNIAWGTAALCWFAFVELYWPSRGIIPDAILDPAFEAVTLNSRRRSYPWYFEGPEHP